MKLKSYFAGTVEAAMALAREELGPDAMLVQSKRSTPETRHIGLYEVVFALDDHQPPPPSAPSTSAKASFSQIFAGERESAIQKLSAEISALKDRIEAIGSAGPLAAAVAVVPTGPVRPRPTDSIFERLRSLEVDEETAAEIASEAAAGGGGSAAVRAAVERRINVDASLGIDGATARVVALVGPPGAGKTAGIVKLATRYGLRARRSVHLITTDVFRVGAAEQLRLYASILGVGFQVAETPLALAQALEEQRHKDLILIDTPGWVNRDLPEIRELAAYMADDRDIDVHTVLPLSNRGCDLDRMSERYAIFCPTKLMFTRLDETDRYGPLLNQSRRTGKPVSFLCAGEQIPEDIQEATVQGIADLILGGLNGARAEGVE